MADYLQISLFCVFMDRDEVEVHKNAIKKERGRYPTILTSRLVNKGFIIWPKVTPKNFAFARTKGTCNPKRAR